MENIKSSVSKRVLTPLAVCVSGRQDISSFFFDKQSGRQ